MWWIIFFIIVIVLFGSSSSTDSDTKVNRKYRDEDDSSKKFASDEESVSNIELNNKSSDGMLAECEDTSKRVEESRKERLAKVSEEIRLKLEALNKSQMENNDVSDLSLIHI